MTGAIGSSRPSTWRIVNISPIERGARVALGIAVVIAGVIFLSTATSVLAVVLETALVLAGLDALVTGATGHCPLYQKLGHPPIRSTGAR